MIKNVTPMAGKVVPKNIPLPKKPTGPVSGKVLPKNPKIKPNIPNVPTSGKVIPNKTFPTKKVAIVAALALVTIGIGKLVTNMVKTNKVKSMTSFQNENKK